MNFQILTLLTTLKNVSVLRKEYIFFDYSDNIAYFLSKLYNEGYIQSYKIIEVNNKKMFYILLRYFNTKPLLQDIKFLSQKAKPLKYSKICKLVTNKNILFFSTPLKIRTLLECKLYKTGGKPLFYIK